MPVTGEENCSTGGGAISPPVNMLDEALFHDVLSTFVRRLSSVDLPHSMQDLLCS